MHMLFNCSILKNIIIYRLFNLPTYDYFKADNSIIQTAAMVPSIEYIDIGGLGADIQLFFLPF